MPLGNRSRRGLRLKATVVVLALAGMFTMTGLVMSVALASVRPPGQPAVNVNPQDSPGPLHSPSGLPSDPPPTKSPPKHSSSPKQTSPPSQPAEPPAQPPSEPPPTQPRRTKHLVRHRHHHQQLKYYVVPHATGGRKIFLTQVAAQVLGSRAKAAELFSLNKGRPEPGGGRLENRKAALRPGWILLLPASAHGAGVHSGRPPKITPVHSSSPRPAPVATPAPTPSAVAMPTISPSKTPAPPAARSAGPGNSAGGLLRLGLIVFVTVLSAGFLFASHRRKAVGPATAGRWWLPSFLKASERDFPTPGERDFPTPGERDAFTASERDAFTASERDAFTASEPDFLPAGEPDPAPAPLPVHQPPVTIETVAAPMPAELPDLDPVPLAPEPASGLSARARGMLGLPEPWAPVGLAQVHQVVLGDDIVAVAIRPAATGARHLVWAPLPYDIPEDGTAVVCLGAGDEGCLFIDLAAAAAPIVVGGDPAAAARLVLSMAHQLCQDPGGDEACQVTVVGSVIPGPTPGGATKVRGFADLGSARRIGRGTGTEIVFCEPSCDEDAVALSSYLASRADAIVPVLLANVQNAPWSFIAQPIRELSRT